MEPSKDTPELWWKPNYADIGPSIIRWMLADTIPHSSSVDKILTLPLLAYGEELAYAVPNPYVEPVTLTERVVNTEKDLEEFAKFTFRCDPFDGIRMVLDGYADGFVNNTLKTPLLVSHLIPIKMLDRDSGVSVRKIFIDLFLTPYFQGDYENDAVYLIRWFNYRYPYGSLFRSSIDLNVATSLKLPLSTRDYSKIQLFRTVEEAYKEFELLKGISASYAEGYGISGEPYVEKWTNGLLVGKEKQMSSQSDDEDEFEDDDDDIYVPTDGDPDFGEDFGEEDDDDLDEDDEEDLAYEGIDDEATFEDDEEDDDLDEDDDFDQFDN